MSENPKRASSDQQDTYPWVHDGGVVPLFAGGYSSEPGTAQPSGRK